MNPSTTKNLRTRLGKTLMKKTSSETDRKEALLDCTYSESRIWIEFRMHSQTPWENIAIHNVETSLFYFLSNTE